MAIRIGIFGYGNLGRGTECAVRQNPDLELAAIIIEPIFDKTNGGSLLMAIRIGIFGYGNLGRGTECAVRQNPDLELAAIFTRRDPASISPLTEGVPVVACGDKGCR